MNVVFVTLYDHYAHGARSLAAALERAGHHARLINFKRFEWRPIEREDHDHRRRITGGGHMPVFEVRPFYDIVCPYPAEVSDAERELLVERVGQVDPDVIGFSLTSAHLPLARELSGLLRRRFPKARQLWGGIYPTMDPVGALQHADAVCVGEGEEALLEWLGDLNRTDVANFHFRTAGGDHISNPLRPLIQDLDSLPYPAYGQDECLIDDGRCLGFDQLDPGHVADMIILTSQRGCPFACTYCLHGNLVEMYPGQRYLRRKSVDRFIAEIQDRVSRFPMFPSLTFWDDIFMIGPSWIEEFSDKFPGRVGRPFGGYAHPRSTTRAIMERLKGAGAAHIVIGIQSASEYIAREIYNRHIETERFVRFGRDMAEVGFDKIAYELLSRCPFEREEDLRQTVLLLAAMPKGVKVNIKQLVFFPFTRINEVDKPRVDLDPRLYHFYEMLYLLAVQPGFDPALLGALVDDAHLRAHPELVEQWVRQLARAAEEKQYLEGRLRELERTMPWGVRRAAAHLVGQLRNRIPGVRRAAIHS